MTHTATRALQVLVISGNSGLRRSIELTLRSAGMAIIGTDSLLAYLARWKDESRLLDAVVLEAGEADPATVGRIQILASIPDLPQTLLVAGAETLHLLDAVRRRPEIDVLVEPFSSEQLVKAVREIADSGVSSFPGSQP
jgi:DNA-binding NtrC family response regulator